jgi:hypothetical protein
VINPYALQIVGWLVSVKAQIWGSLSKRVLFGNCNAILGVLSQIEGGVSTGIKYTFTPLCITSKT